MPHWGCFQWEDGQKNLQGIITMHCYCMGEGFPVEVLILVWTLLGPGVKISYSFLETCQMLLKNDNVIKKYLFYWFHMALFWSRPWVLRYHVLKINQPSWFWHVHQKHAQKISDASQMVLWVVLVYASFSWFSLLNNYSKKLMPSRSIWFMR